MSKNIVIAKKENGPDLAHAMISWFFAPSKSNQHIALWNLADKIGILMSMLDRTRLVMCDLWKGREHKIIKMIWQWRVTVKSIHFSGDVWDLCVWFRSMSCVFGFLWLSSQIVLFFHNSSLKKCALHKGIC